MVICDERLAFEQLTPEEQERVKRYQDESGFEIIESYRDDGKIVPTLINGRPIDRDDWREVVRIGGRSCTGTIVGKNCAITAAHCGRNNSRSVLEVYRDGQLETVRYRMIHHPQWRNQTNWDVAVLVFDSEVDNVSFARVGIDYTFNRGADVDIAGYGCTRPGGSGGNDGVLRFGESKVQGFTGTDVVTSWRQGNGGALCFGDSGGPMFADGSNAGGQRTLIAVNSKGNIRDTNYNLRLDLEGVASWLKQMADQYSLEMIGVNSDPTPPADPPGNGGSAPSDVWAYEAKIARQTAAHYELLATQFEAKGAGSPSTNPTPEQGDDCLFGL